MIFFKKQILEVFCSNGQSTFINFFDFGVKTFGKKKLDQSVRRRDNCRSCYIIWPGQQLLSYNGFHDICVFFNKTTKIYYVNHKITLGLRDEFCWNSRFDTNILYYKNYELNTDINFKFKWKSIAVNLAVKRIHKRTFKHEQSWTGHCSSSKVKRAASNYPAGLFQSPKTNWTVITLSMSHEGKISSKKTLSRSIRTWAEATSVVQFH